MEVANSNIARTKLHLMAMRCRRVSASNASAMIGGLAQVARGVALITAGGDALVLALGQPRIARDVTCIGEPSLDARLATEDFVDRASPAIDHSLIVNRVQLLEQVLYLERGKFRTRLGNVQIDGLDFARRIEPLDRLNAGAAHLTCAVIEDREHTAGGLAVGRARRRRLRLLHRNSLSPRQPRIFCGAARLEGLRVDAPFVAVDQ